MNVHLIEEQFSYPPETVVKGSNAFKLRVCNGLSLPETVGQLRYSQYIEEQGKPYAAADHEKKTLFDDLDPVSLHMLTENHQGQLLSSLRITPCTVYTPASHDLFLESLGTSIEQIGFLSRLVITPSLEAKKTLKSIFKFSYLHCLKSGTHIGLISTSPRLKPLFLRYGWRSCGDPYEDQTAGTQCPLYLDALDLEHLRKMNSPYLD